MSEDIGTCTVCIISSIIPKGHVISGFRTISMRSVFCFFFFHGRFHAVASNIFFKVSVCDKLWGHEGLLGHWFPQILKSADWLTMIYFHYFSFRSLFFWWPLHWTLLLMPLDVNSASLEEKKHIPLSLCGVHVSPGSSGIPVCSPSKEAPGADVAWKKLLSQFWCCRYFQGFKASKYKVLPIWLESVRVM